MKLTVIVLMNPCLTSSSLPSGLSDVSFQIGNTSPEEDVCSRCVSSSQLHYLQIQGGLGSESPRDLPAIIFSIQFCNSNLKSAKKFRCACSVIAQISRLCATYHFPYIFIAWQKCSLGLTMYGSTVSSRFWSGEDVDVLLAEHSQVVSG